MLIQILCQWEYPAGSVDRFGSADRSTRKRFCPVSRLLVRPMAVIGGRRGIVNGPSRCRIATSNGSDQFANGFAGVQDRVRPSGEIGKLRSLIDPQMAIDGGQQILRP